MDFRSALSERVWVAEGAMGTRLLSKGIPPDTCLEALNLSRPALIREIHEEYRAAGAEIFKSNTFGANPARLTARGMGKRCREINIAGVQLARAVAGNEGFVAGVAGPTGAKARADAGRQFTPQMEALAEAGADFILLETFRDLNELGEAIRAAHAACELPVVAQVSPDERGELKGGIGAEEFVPGILVWEVDAIGCNCGVGLESMLETVRRIGMNTGKPLIAQPSAGLPFSRQGHWVYPCLPEEMAEAAARFAEAGARIVGGCCGTIPDHIAAIREAVVRKDTGKFPVPAAMTGGVRRRRGPSGSGRNKCDE
jgi:methionine synthase I (cobalamin-dependent)